VVSSHWGDKEVSLTDDQLKFVAFMTILDWISAAGFMDAGLYNTFKKIKREQLRKKDEGTSSSRIPSRPRPRLRPRPLPARNLN